MSAAWHCALGRALSHVSDGQRADVLEPLLSRMSWELSQLVSAQCAGLALVMRRPGRPAICGRDSRERDFPAESIVGLLCSLADERKEYRVTDHSLDTLRFMASSCRTSILARLELPEPIVAGGDAALWMGLMCGAAPAHIEEARSLAAAISEWFVAYGPTIASLQAAWERVRGAEARSREAMAIMHDARAPLGALKHILEGELQDARMDSSDASLVLSQLGYLGDLLSRGSLHPNGRRQHACGGCDVGEVLARVARRCAAGSPCGGEVALACPAQPVLCAIPALELERVITNVVGNAVRFAKPGGVSVGLEVEASGRSAAIQVADDGPGFSAEVLRSFEERRDDPIASSEGWGIGLVSSRRRIEEHGGSMQLRFSPQGGSLVEVRIPCMRSAGHFEGSVAERKAAYESAAAPQRGAATLCIVDDDEGHARSIEKVMRARGLFAACFCGVAAAVEHLARQPCPVLCDVHMPNGGAESLLAELRRRRIAVRVAVMSGDSSDDLLYRVAAAGAETFFDKPLDVEALVAWLGPAEAAA